MFRDNFACQRLLLHAAYLSFNHPQTGNLIEINAPLDDCFSALLKDINLR
jgi:23S rRNA-/tRNA-specific pseudouridylate synthase